MRRRNWNYGMVFLCMCMAVMLAAPMAQAATNDGNINFVKMAVTQGAADTFGQTKTPATMEDNADLNNGLKLSNSAGCAECHNDGQLAANFNLKSQCLGADIVADNYFMHDTVAMTKLGTDQSAGQYANNGEEKRLDGTVLASSIAGHGGQAFATMWTASNSVHRVISLNMANDKLMGGYDVGYYPDSQILGR